MKHFSFRVIVSLIFCLGLVSSGHAQGVMGDFWKTVEEELNKAEKLIVGLGARISSRPYVEMDARTFPVPIIVGKYKRLWLDGSSAAVILNDNEHLYASAVLKPRFMGYGTGDSPFLSGMEDRDWSWDAGMRLTWENDYFDLNVTGLQDIGGVSGGQILRAIFSSEFLEGALTPRAGIQWESKETVDYYYGVQGHEATSARAAYQGDSTVNYILGMTLGLPLGEHWTVIADLEWEGFASEIQDSPIIEDDGNLVSVVGIAYRF